MWRYFRHWTADMRAPNAHALSTDHALKIRLSKHAGTGQKSQRAVAKIRFKGKDCVAASCILSSDGRFTERRKAIMLHLRVQKLHMKRICWPDMWEMRSSGTALACAIFERSKLPESAMTRKANKGINGGFLSNTISIWMSWESCMRSAPQTPDCGRKSRGAMHFLKKEVFWNRLNAGSATLDSTLRIVCSMIFWFLKMGTVEWQPMKNQNRWNHDDQTNNDDQL